MHVVPCHMGHRDDRPLGAAVIALPGEADELARRARLLHLWERRGETCCLQTTVDDASSVERMHHGEWQRGLARHMRRAAGVRHHNLAPVDEAVLKLFDPASDLHWRERRVCAADCQGEIEGGTERWHRARVHE